MLILDNLIDAVREIPVSEHDVKRINSIADLHPGPRQQSKTPTFALTYQGTHMTLMAKCGFTREVAQQIEGRYHVLYKVSDDWVAKKLDEASRVGYITAAFGLRVRTPRLAQVIRGNSRTPHEAEAEGRSAGNALGQSWCLLNSRAGSEFMGKVRASEHRLDVKPCSQIHDAQYYLARDDVDLVHWINENLVEAVQWQDHVDIAHDLVKLGGELSLFHPSWAYEVVIPNGADTDAILEVVGKHLRKLEAKP